MPAARRRVEGPTLRARFGSFDQPELDALLERQPFSHTLELFVPLCTVDPDTVLQPRGAPFFFSASLALRQLVDPAFVAAYLRPGGARLYVLSCCTPLECSDAVALTPDGTLHLSLTQETYQQLGVPGRAGPRARGPAAAQGAPRYSADLRLLARSFQPGQPRYERVARCLTERWPQPLRLLVACCGAGDGGSQSVAFPASARAARHPLTARTRTLTRLALPPLERAFGGHPGAALDAASDVALLSSLADWVGALALGATGDVHQGDMPARGRAGAALADGADGAPGACWDDCESAWPAQPGGWAQAHKWTGLLTPEQLRSAVGVARGVVASGRAPWAALLVCGFRDSPVAWLPQNQTRLAGDHLLILFVLPHQRWLLLDMAGTDR